MVHLFWIVPLVLSIIYLTSPRFRGDIAETRTRRILEAGLEKSRYTVLDDVTIPSGGGTAQIDHLVFSRFGIFVIESEYVTGWVAGGEFQEQWKSYAWGRFSRFDNPLHRCAVRVTALEKALGIPSRIVHPMVVLVGHKGFKSPAPPGVIAPGELVSSIRKRGQPLLEGEQVTRLLSQLEAVRVRPTHAPVIGKWRLLQFALIAILAAGLYLAFGDELREFRQTVENYGEQRAAPGTFHPDGSRKTEQEMWEDSLVCAFSQDTGRCSCYEPGGPKADIDPEKCRSLAERGSILKQ